MNAAKDADVATFATVNISDHTTFENHQHNIETAIMLFHHNSGLARFREIEDFESNNLEVSNAAKMRLKKEILKQKLSHVQKTNLVKKFLEEEGIGGFKDAQYGRQGNRHADAITCAACGVRNLDAGDEKDHMIQYSLGDFEQFKFDDDLAEQLHNLLDNNTVDIPISNNGDLKTINPNESRSYFKCANLDKKYSYYHLHREFVNAESTDHGSVSYSVSRSITFLLSLLQCMYYFIICFFVSDHISIYFICSVIFALCVKSMRRTTRTMYSVWQTVMTLATTPALVYHLSTTSNESY